MTDKPNFMYGDIEIESPIPPPDTVTISKETYHSLLQDSNFLNILMAYGVDSWESWDAAVSAFNQD